MLLVSQDSHFLSPQEFKQLYYRLLHRYTNLLPRLLGFTGLRTLCFRDSAVQRFGFMAWWH